jgi:transglutaminase-like putative cysteine protease
MRVSLHHVTQYRYDRKVRLGPQIIRLRPAPHYHGHLLGYSMTLEPADADIRWQPDPFGNQTAEVRFADKTDLFRVSVELTIDHQTTHAADVLLSADDGHFPLRYEPRLIRELAPYRHTGPAGPLFQQYLKAADPHGMRTAEFVVMLNQALHRDIRYRIRKEHGVQTPERTLQEGSGSCRDSGWLLVQLLRHSGFAARFVSGYLIQLPSEGMEPSNPEVSSSELHAWCEVYLPGAGWTGLDPTSGRLTDVGHVPLACAPDPAAAAPVEGSVEPCEVDFSYRIDIAATDA